MSRRCWTCNSDHDLDAACPSSQAVRSMRSVGQPGNEMADHTSPDLFDDPEDVPKFGPVFTATYDSEDACCGKGIESGQTVRADGQGGWIHADDECERLTLS